MTKSSRFRGHIRDIALHSDNRRFPCQRTTIRGPSRQIQPPRTRVDATTARNALASAELAALGKENCKAGYVTTMPWRSRWRQVGKAARGWTEGVARLTASSNIGCCEYYIPRVYRRRGFSVTLRGTGPEHNKMPGAINFRAFAN